VHPDLLQRAWSLAGAERWGVTTAEFGRALARSLTARFAAETPSVSAEREYVGSLQLADLGLACACALGREAAWEYFVREYRPILLRVASRNAVPDVAREVADSLYADLFGLEERAGVRRSLFDYYHGRSTLASWLRAVVAQRLVDRARSVARQDPLPEAGDPGEPAEAARPPDIDQGRFLPLAQQAVQAAIAGLEPGDRLRMALYYTRNLTLAAIGRVTGESEATVSRKLDKARRRVREAVEQALRDDHGLTTAQIRASFDYVRTDPAFDLARTLPPE
jgi:RNA polymerase sigma-70 factor (ECF subfamily)